jgi:hypothetical protein
MSGGICERAKRDLDDSYEPTGAKAGREQIRVGAASKLGPLLGGLSPLGCSAAC